MKYRDVIIEAFTQYGVPPKLIESNLKFGELNHPGIQNIEIPPEKFKQAVADILACLAKNATESEDFKQAILTVDPLKPD